MGNKLHNPALPELFGMLFQVGNALERRVNAYLRPAGVSTVHWQICAVLSRRPGRAARLGELAELLCTSRQNVKQVAATLVGLGWVEMGPDPDDGRAVLLTFTEAGEAYWAARAGADLDFLAASFGMLDGGEAAALVRILGKLLPHLEGAST